MFLKNCSYYGKKTILEEDVPSPLSKQQQMIEIVLNTHMKDTLQEMIFCRWE